MEQNCILHVSKKRMALQACSNEVPAIFSQENVLSTLSSEVRLLDFDIFHQRENDRKLFWNNFFDKYMREEEKSSKDVDDWPETKEEGCGDSTGKMPSKDCTGKIPSKDCTGKIPSKDCTGKMPSEDCTGKMPSEDCTGKIPSKDCTGKIPSKDCTGQIPSKDLTGKMPSKDCTSKMPSKDCTSKMLSKDCTGKIPSKDCTGKMPSKDCTGKMPFKDCTGKIPSKDCTGKIPSKDCTGKMPSKDCTSKMPSKNCTGKIPSKDCTGKMPSKDCTGKIPSKDCTGKMPSKESVASVLMEELDLGTLPVTSSKLTWRPRSKSNTSVLPHIALVARVGMEGTYGPDSNKLSAANNRMGSWALNMKLPKYVAPIPDCSCSSARNDKMLHKSSRTKKSAGFKLQKVELIHDNEVTSSSDSNCRSTTNDKMKSANIHCTGMELGDNSVMHQCVRISSGLTMSQKVVFASDVVVGNMEPPLERKFVYVKRRRY